MADLPSLESTFTDETRLLLYALKSQATHGPTEIKSNGQHDERGTGEIRDVGEPRENVEL